MEERSKRGTGAINRRRFVQTGTAAALSAASWQRVLGANERIGIGVIGYGLIGEPHVEDFQEQPDVDMVAVAEAHRGRMEEAAAAMGGNVARYNDFRKLLENRDVQAVVISTPDHWHALQTMLACAAGKDVYVEKPLTVFVREGRWMVEVARRTKRVVQAGTQQRSGPLYHHAREFIRAGRLGKVFSVRVDFHRNLMPGLGHPPDQDPPADLDWDMFLGPAPRRPYNPNRGIYNFRWFWDYSGGQMTNWGAHSMDIVYWILDAAGPTAVYSTGGRTILDDNCETPDSQETIFEFPGFSMVTSVRECCLGSGSDPLGFFGTNGSLMVSRERYTVTPDRKIPPVNVFPGVRTGHPVGGPQAAPEPRQRTYRTERVEERYGNARNLLKLHARNFLDCIKSRQTPISDLESSHRASTALHLANLSMRLGRRIRWDAEKEEIIGDPEASQTLVRPYRKPWDAELRSLQVS